MKSFNGSINGFKGKLVIPARPDSLVESNNFFLRANVILCLVYEKIKEIDSQTSHENSDYNPNNNAWGFEELIAKSQRYVDYYYQ